MSMSMFFRNFLPLPEIDVENGSCHETSETEHEDKDPKTQKTQVVSSDDESNSIASSNTEICGEIDYQDFDICDEKTDEVVRKGDVNDFRPSECEGFFGVNHWLCKVPCVQSEVSKQVVESTNDKQKDPIQELLNQVCKTTAVAGREVKSRPILLIPVDLCGRGTKEICIEKSASITDSSVTSIVLGELVATKENFLPSIPNSSNTALLSTSEGPNKTIDHFLGKTQEPPLKTFVSCSNGITDRRQLLRKADDQENNKTHVRTFQLRNQVKLYHAANDRGPTSSLCSDSGLLLSSKLPPGSTLFNSQGVFRTTDKEKPFMCGFCGKTSDKYHTLNQHIAMQHETLEKRYACEICGSRFAQPWNLAAHARQHTQERPFVCDQCGRRFKSQGVLGRHAAAHTKDRPFSCKICHKSFESQSYLLFKHSKFHKKQKASIICNICKKGFNHNFHLRQHMTVHSGEKLFKCTFCDLHFRRDIRLQQHMTTHQETKELLQGDAQDAEKIINVPIQSVTHPDKPNVIQCISEAEEKTAQELVLSSNCADPLKVLQDNASLVESSSHPSQLENRKVLIESSFTKVSSRLSSATHPYQRKGYLTRAVDRKRVSLASGIVYEDEVLTLESLQYSTTTQTLLSSSHQSLNDDGKSSSFRNPVHGVQSIVASKPTHGDSLRRYQHVVYTKGKEKPFSCGYCGKAYNLKHSVYGHIMVQHEEKRYSCEFCGKRYAQPSGLAMHVRIHKPEKPFTCDQCGKLFRRDYDLRKHKYTHSEERLFHCDKCSKSYKTRDMLSRHKESHQTVEQRKGVVCDICKRKFSRPSVFKEHMRIHTGEKPFKCTLCEKQFRKKVQLRNHVETHNGTNRNANKQCSICGKTFWASHMPEHMRMHAGEKPFECNICGKRFPRKPNLEGHIRSHTGEKPFACIGCDKRFALYSNMMTHKAKCTVLLKTLA